MNECMSVCTFAGAIKVWNVAGNAAEPDASGLVLTMVNSNDKSMPAGLEEVPSGEGAEAGEKEAGVTSVTINPVYPTCVASVYCSLARVCNVLGMSGQDGQGVGHKDGRITGAFHRTH